MCLCNPSIRTPWCGGPGCERPGQYRIKEKTTMEWKTGNAPRQGTDWLLIVDPNEPSKMYWANRTEVYESPEIAPPPGWVWLEVPPPRTPQRCRDCKWYVVKNQSTQGHCNCPVPIAAFSAIMVNPTMSVSNEDGRHCGCYERWVPSGQD